MAADVRRLTKVSGLQSQAIPPARVAPRVPWYVYAAAILLLGWASVLLIAWLSLERFDTLFWKAMVPVTLELAIGCGLLLRRRWGWLLGVATAALFIVDGLHSIIFVRGEYVVIDALIHRLIPATVILVCLLPVRRGVLSSTSDLTQRGIERTMRSPSVRSKPLAWNPTDAVGPTWA